jgi:hypothetical protein
VKSGTPKKAEFVEESGIFGLFSLGGIGKSDQNGTIWPIAEGTLGGASASSISELPTRSARESANDLMAVRTERAHLLLWVINWLFDSDGCYAPPAAYPFWRAPVVPSRGRRHLIGS